MLPRVVAAHRAVAAWILNLLLMLLAIELGSALLLTLGRWNAPGDARARLGYYAAQPWADAYWREFASSRRKRYEPFALWRTRPFRGELVNVDEDGLRLTPGAACGDGAYTVFALGGSTMWGTGSPDDETIPARLQDGLRVGRPVCVLNFGEDAYVSSQSLVFLEAWLRRGRIPDLVISYDGVNDVFAAYQEGRAGSHQNRASVAARFEAGLDPLRLFAATHTADLLGVLYRRAIGPAAEAAGDPGALAEEVVRVYRANLRHLAGLARDHGFETAFFWQPALLVDPKPLTPEERRIRAGAAPGLRALFEEVHGRIAALGPGEVHDLSGIFAGETGPIWIDLYHVVPRGNALVAGAMLEALGRPPRGG